MIKDSIYQFVKSKLISQGAENTKDGLLVLSDKKLFLLFVSLERAVRSGSFEAVLTVAFEIETYLVSIEKRQLMWFMYMYLRVPRQTILDEQLPDGRIKKSSVFSKNLTDEDMLIGLWANVKYKQVGQGLLRIIYRDS